ncbi:diguanylate cyclase [Stutzerimonas nitrititolerans]|uniref:diguanylate cyclase n=1 Tax=Stutzerimonas nitrititolerans TaxID=2482751 RepID=UPI0028A11591|nr:diguanylate cyclase [Stutzerimonas nitrititolerans]
MSDTGNAELQNQLQALNERFVERLRQELPELARTAGELQEPLPRERLRQLMLDIHEQLHRLAGSAGTFGFARLGEQARSLELHADRWLAAAKPGTQSLHGFARALQRFATDALAESPEQATAVPQTQQHRPDCLIYLLESDAQAGHDMGQTLGNFGYDVRLFTELAQLEAAAAGDRPDALVIGLQHGGELAAVSELQHRLPAHLPLLVISDRADFDSLLTAVRAGAQGYFLRPLDITQLESSLERCLNRHLGAPFRVMIVDDDADLAARYSLVLRNSQMLVQTLQDPSLLLETMRTFNPEVLLLDVNMPHCSGPELAQMIRLNDEWLRVPIIYLSAETDINRQMEALLKAGDDFITKPISDNALIASVYSHAQRARSLSTALSRDSLTGLLKHADIKEQLALEVERAARSGKPTSVVMLDLDHFKRVNDTYGHAAGDNVIRALANLLRQRLRRIDSLGRYGGEEFVVVLPECSAEQARRIIEEIRSRFSAISFRAGVHTFNVSLSAGISETDGHAKPGVLLERADQALYAAKHNGRNQVRVAQ